MFEESWRFEGIFKFEEISSFEETWKKLKFSRNLNFWRKGGRNKWSDGEFCVVVILNSSPSGLKFSTTTKQNLTSDHGVLLLWSDGEFCVVVIYNFSPEGLELKNVITQNSPSDHLFLPPFKQNLVTKANDGILVHRKSTKICFYGLYRVIL